jgi:hypothetical protein
MSEVRAGAKGSKFLLRCSKRVEPSAKGTACLPGRFVWFYSGKSPNKYSISKNVYSAWRLFF